VRAVSLRRELRQRSGRRAGAAAVGGDLIGLLVRSTSAGRGGAFALPVKVDAGLGPACGPMNASSDRAVLCGVRRHARYRLAQLVRCGLEVTAAGRTAVDADQPSPDAAIPVSIAGTRRVTERCCPVSDPDVSSDS